MAFTSNIVQGDNGVILFFNVADADGNTGVLSNISRIECKIVYGSGSTVKTCNIVDVNTGKCSTVLTSNDLPSAGRYAFQLTLYYTNGNKFTSNIERFTVDPKL